ncbi:endonuclease NucS domain-containing protein [Planctomycetota bacterium]
MIEKEMEDLLWFYPDNIFREKLTPFRRQPSSEVGRADLVFTDELGNLLIMEIKKGRLGRNDMTGAIGQLKDYYGAMKKEFPEKAVDLMLVANEIPRERKIALEKEDIEPKEIPEAKFRKIAKAVGYIFKSEKGPGGPPPPPPPPPGKVEKAWYYWRDPLDREYVLAFVNGKGSCSQRFWDAESFAFIKQHKPNPTGDFQEQFKDFINPIWRLELSKHPNLEKTCKVRLPEWVINELRPQIEDIQRKLDEGKQSRG